MCLSPVRVHIDPDGGKPTPDPEGSTQIPCGKCTECVTKRACEWALRAQHEISHYDESSFITLTYDDDHLPSHLVVKDKFQNFMKSLRKRIPHKKIKYMVSHEYGTNTFRPHHHVLIFGYNPPKQSFIRTTKKGYPLFISESITKIWNHGFHSIGEANAKTAYYIAAYSLKGKTHNFFHPVTGEEIETTDAMNSSNGIGLLYLIKNASQLVHSGTPLPRYYLKKMQDEEQEKLIKKFPNLIDKITELPLLLQHYENNNASSQHHRSSHELLAKNIITNQSMQLYSGEFRSAPDFTDREKLLEDHLRHNRDSYVSKEKS